MTIPDIHVSKSNTKMGKVHSISLLPVVTCIDKPPCRHDCYARKIMRFRPTVRKAWDDNTFLALLHPDKYWSQLREYLTTHEVELFRYHVGGDIPNEGYLHRMIGMANSFPHVRFLCFTKRYNFSMTGSPCPANLTIKLSMWPNYSPPGGVLTKDAVLFHSSGFAWMQDGTETRVPEDAIKCAGTCESCMKCWGSTKDVVFKKH